MPADRNLITTTWVLRNTTRVDIRKTGAIGDDQHTQDALIYSEKLCLPKKPKILKLWVTAFAGMTIFSAFSWQGTSVDCLAMNSIPSEIIHIEGAAY